MADSIKVLVEAVLKNEKFQQQIKKNQKTSEGFSKKLGGVKKIIGGLFAGFTIAAFLNGIKKGIAVSAEFEQAIANVKSVSGASSKELQKIARAAGKDTVFSAKQAADALYFLASAGLDVNQMGEVLNPTLNLAAAAQLGIAEATDVVVNNLKTFSTEGLTAENAADIMAKTVQSASTDMRQLSEALKMAGGTASVAGIPFKDLNTLVAGLADLGIKGSEAGTKLRQTIARLVAPTSDAKEALAGYGISQKEINELLPTPIKLFKRLADANMSTEDAVRIFGVRQLSVFKLIKDGIPNLELLEDKISNSGGAAQKAADVQLDTLQGALKLLSSAVLENVLMFGMDGGLLDMLKNTVTWLTNIVKQIPDSITGFIIFTKEIEVRAKQFLGTLQGMGLAIKSLFDEDAAEALAKFDEKFELIEEEYNTWLREMVSKEVEADDESVENKKMSTDALLAELERFKSGHAAQQDAIKGKEKKTNAELINEFKASIDKKLSYVNKYMYAFNSMGDSLFEIEKNRMNSLDENDKKGKAKSVERLKKLWRFKKQAQMTTAVINAAQAVLTTMANVPYPLNIPLAIAQGVAGAMQVAKIASTMEPNVESFAKGSPYIASDQMAQVHAGERIIPAGMNIPGINNMDLVGAAMRGLGTSTINNVTNTTESNDNNSRTFNFYGINDLSAARNELQRIEGQEAWT